VYSPPSLSCRNKLSRRLIVIFVVKPEGKRPLGRPSRRWVNNIRIDLREIEWEVVDWTYPAQDRDQWRAVVNLPCSFWQSATPWRRIGEWRYSSMHSWPWPLYGGEWSASHPGYFTPRGKAPDTHWIGSWVGPRAGQDTVVERKIPSPCRDSNHRSFSP
jgi:hypothetical protein